jgi:hypothetical protein
MEKVRIHSLLPKKWPQQIIWMTQRFIVTALNIGLRMVL